MNARKGVDWLELRFMGNYVFSGQRLASVDLAASELVSLQIVPALRYHGIQGLGPRTDSSCRCPSAFCQHKKGYQVPKLGRLSKGQPSPRASSPKGRSPVRPVDFFTWDGKHRVICSPAFPFQAPGGFHVGSKGGNFHLDKAPIKKKKKYPVAMNSTHNINQGKWKICSFQQEGNPVAMNSTLKINQGK